MPGHTGEEVARDILSYFVRNPQTADDLEGIARWRLMRETIRRSVEDTSSALEWLAEQGFLVREVTAAGGPIFRLNPVNRVRAEAFLAELEKGRAKGGLP
jgi:hypothetical protein